MACLNLYRAQWKAFRRYRSNIIENDEPIEYQYGRMVTVYGIPLAVSIFSYCNEFNLDISNILLTVLGIIAGALLALFAQLAAWRQTFDDKKHKNKRIYNAERWLIDSSVSHVLAASFSAVISCIVLIIAFFLSKLQITYSVQLVRICNSLAVLFSIHTLLTLLLVMPALYSAYVQVNDVSPQLNGNDKTN